MDASGLLGLGGWLGLNAREMDLNALDAGVLSAVALALPEHVVQELRLRSNLASVVAGGLLGPPDVARRVFSRCAECATEGGRRVGRVAGGEGTVCGELGGLGRKDVGMRVCVGGSSLGCTGESRRRHDGLVRAGFHLSCSAEVRGVTGAGRDVMEAKVEEEQKEKQSLKEPNFCKGVQGEKQQGVCSKEAKDGQMSLALALVAAVSRAGHACLPESPIVQLFAAVEMLVVLICLLSSTRREGRSGSHMISVVVKAVLMIALYMVQLVIPFADKFGLGQGIKFSCDRSLLDMGGCVLALVIVFMSSAESQASRWLSQVTALSSFLIGAYLPCLLHEAHLEELCKLPTTNFLVVTLCVTFSSLLSSAARFQGNRGTIFKWRTKDGDLVSKLG